MSLRKRRNGWLILVACVMGCLMETGVRAAEPLEGLLCRYPAEGDLRLADGTSATMARGAETALRFVPGRAGTGVYPQPGTALSIPVSKLNPQEGTLAFWFRSDWSDPCYRHSVLAELAAGNTWRLRWAYGYPHIPNGIYVEVNTGPKWTGAKAGGSLYEGSHNLFSGGEWRHYALRWSAKRGAIEMVVDGYKCPRGGRYTCGEIEPRDAQLLLSGEVRGAFDEARVYDRWLDDAELIAAEGVTEVKAYLQEQQPPGARRMGGAGRQVSFVEPATGERVTTTQTYAGGLYNPDDMPELPKTPHTRWARPLAGGPLKVLMVMPAEFFNELQTQLREGIELWQRLDMTCHIGNRMCPEIATNDYDVIVVSHQGHAGVWQGWTSIEEPLRRWILERVAGGRSGLVLTYPRNLDSPVNALLKNQRPADALLRGFPVEAMHKAVLDRYEAVYDLTDDWFETATNLAASVIEVYDTTNRFQIVKLNYAMGPGWGLHTALTPDTALNCAATLPQYDYWQALAARAVLYAANRAPAVRIDALRVEPEAWTATLTGGGILWHRARDLWGRVYAEGEQPVTGGVVRLPSVPLPPRGIVDLVLKDAAGGVLDWFSATVPRVADADIVSIALDRPAWAAGETVSGKVGLRLPPGAPCRLVFYLGDHEGRRLVRAEKPVENGARAAAFAISLPGSVESLLMRVDVQLWQGERLVAERSADCPVPRTTTDGFFAGMSGGVHNRAPNRLMRRMFRDEYGVNMMGAGNRHTLAMAARDNLVNFAYATHLGYPIDEASFKPWIENWDTFFPEKLQVDPAKLDAYRSLFLSLGEEHYILLSGSRHPEALARFHRHLQERYKNLEELNTVWNAAFKSWDEIPMLKPEMIDVMKFDYGVQAFESHRFMEHLFAQKHADLADWLRRADPAARVGIHVGWDLWMARGYDFWLLSRGMESMIGYGGVQNQYIRSFFKDYYGSWWHYAIGGHHEARWHPWYMLLSGARGFMWYTMGPQIWGATTGDLQPSSDWKAAAPEFMAAAAAGDLLSRTHYVQDQVAIHYSQDSMQAGMGPALSWLHNNVVNLLFDGGVPFRFLSYDELAQGRAAGVPLLILPGSISLSPGETEAIRAYVRQGGTVWADRLPGTYDHHGRKLEASQLADLFENLEEEAVPGAGTMQIGREGRVILAPLDNYAFSRNVGEHLPARALLDEIVRRAGVKRVARALAADGTPANAIWLAGWRQGRQRYLVAAKDYAVADRLPARVDLVFDGPAHVYEGRGGRYLGRRDRIGDTLETARGKLYALLPYRVDAIEAKVRTGWLARQPRRGGDLRIDVKLQASDRIGSDDLHLLRVTVVGPDGMELTALRRKVCVYGGEGVVRLPVAYNDPAGAYTVRLHDTATGLEQTLGYSLD